MQALAPRATPARLQQRAAARAAVAPRPSAAAARTQPSARSRAAVAARVVRENPQNTPEVEVFPTPELSARQAVEAQLQAIQRNDTPWTNHGIALMYEFCYDAGSMERSRYFGFSKDLYHLDHFMGALANHCPELINCASYTVGPETAAPEADGAVAFEVAATPRSGGAAAAFEFVMARQEWGLRKGSWQTKSLKRVDGGSS